MSVNIEEVLSNISELEGELKDVTNRPNGSPGDVVHSMLRGQLRQSYCALLLDDIVLSSAHDIEQRLWKMCFHKSIDEYRRWCARVKDSSAELECVQRAFESFLCMAYGFYYQLVASLRNRYGVQMSGVNDYDRVAMATFAPGNDEYVEAHVRDAGRHAVHRAVVYLGDIARYRELLSSSSRKSYDTARYFYTYAARLDPLSGSPHNQLGVIATYLGDEMSALYHYARSLNSITPFHNSCDNVESLFENNRRRLGVIPPLLLPGMSGSEAKASTNTPSSAASNVNASINSSSGIGKKGGGGARASGRPISRAKQTNELFARFVQLHGMREVDECASPEFKVVSHYVLESLRGLLKGKGLSETATLRMMIVNIAALDALNGVCDPNPNPGDLHMFSFCMKFAVRVLLVCIRSAKGLAKLLSDSAAESNRKRNRSNRRRGGQGAQPTGGGSERGSKSFGGSTSGVSVISGSSAGGGGSIKSNTSTFGMSGRDVPHLKSIKVFLDWISCNEWVQSYLHHKKNSRQLGASELSVGVDNTGSGGSDPYSSETLRSEDVGRLLAVLLTVLPWSISSFEWKRVASVPTFWHQEPRRALPEDVELEGFIPTTRCLSNVDLRTVYDEKTERRARIYYLVGLGVWLARVPPGEKFLQCTTKPSRITFSVAKSLDTRVRGKACDPEERDSMLPPWLDSDGSGMGMGRGRGNSNLNYTRNNTRDDEDGAWNGGGGFGGCAYGTISDYDVDDMDGEGEGEGEGDYEVEYDQHDFEMYSAPDWWKEMDASGGDDEDDVGRQPVPSSNHPPHHASIQPGRQYNAHSNEHTGGAGVAGVRRVGAGGGGNTDASLPDALLNSSFFAQPSAGMDLLNTSASIWARPEPKLPPTSSQSGVGVGVGVASGTVGVGSPIMTATDESSTTSPSMPSGVVGLPPMNMVNRGWSRGGTPTTSQPHPSTPQPGLMWNLGVGTVSADTPGSSMWASHTGVNMDRPAGSAALAEDTDDQPHMPPSHPATISAVGGASVVAGKGNGSVGGATHTSWGDGMLPVAQQMAGSDVVGAVGRPSPQLVSENVPVVAYSTYGHEDGSGGGVVGQITSPVAQGQLQSGVGVGVGGSANTGSITQIFPNAGSGGGRSGRAGGGDQVSKYTDASGIDAEGATGSMAIPMNTTSLSEEVAQGSLFSPNIMHGHGQSFQHKQQSRAHSEMPSLTPLWGSMMGSDESGGAGAYGLPHQQQKLMNAPQHYNASEGGPLSSSMWNEQGIGNVSMAVGTMSSHANRTNEASAP
eukprot:CFRG0539T1